ncbi:MAG TPA: hypothetical protein VGO67_25740 [Verrucomicrobiae bacterium]|jgi:hypothetical protein
MSLINDALKRASQSDKNRPVQAPVPLPMPPAAAPSPGSNSSPLLIAIIIVAVLGLAISAWLYLSPANPSPPIAADAPAPIVNKPIPEPPVSTPTPAPEIQKISPPPVAPGPAQIVGNAPNAALNPPVAPPETFPTNLTVKAIFYNKTNPRALVNGQTVAPGDKIGDVLVKGILSDRIFLDWKGQSKVLMMGGQ